MSESPSSEVEPLWRSGSSTDRAELDGTGATRKRLLLLAATGVSLGCLIGVASWFRPHPFPVLLPIFIHAAGERNDFATAQFRQDAASLRAGRWFSRVIGPGNASTAPDQLGSMLQASAGVRSDENLVTVLCAPARIGVGSTSPGDRAEVFITPGGRAEEVSKWVPLRDVLRAIDRNPARRVLLLLDLMRPPADPLHVQLGDDVTDRIQTELAEMNKVGDGRTVDSALRGERGPGFLGVRGLGAVGLPGVRRGSVKRLGRSRAEHGQPRRTGHIARAGRLCGSSSRPVGRTMPGRPSDTRSPWLAARFPDRPSSSGSTRTAIRAARGSGLSGLARGRVVDARSLADRAGRSIRPLGVARARRQRSSPPKSRGEAGANPRRFTQS